VVQDVTACQDNPLAKPDTTLPAKASLGDLPQIAITTGNADALECLVRKLGVDDSEISSGGGNGHIHLYTDAGSAMGQGSNSFQAGFSGGSGNFTDAAMLW